MSGLALLVKAGELVPVGDFKVETITSLEEVARIARETQKQFWQLVPPASDDPLYIHPENIVRPVDWGGNGWPDILKRQMYAEMGVVNSSMYPFYRLTVVEERSGEMVYYNSFNQEVWRTPAPSGYNEYLFAFECYGAESVEDLTTQQKIFGRSSNVGTTILLLPSSFAESYAEDAALEMQATALAEPMAAPSPLPAVVAEVETLDNGTVLVYLEDPPESSGDLLEVFSSPGMITMGTQSGGGMLDENPADGLSDVWVREMAGGVIDPLDSDLDGDGMSFQAEHDLGLNPNVANPGFFRIFMSDMFNPLRPVLELNDVQGVDYELDESYDLVAGSWLHIPLSLNGNSNPAPYIIVIPYSAPETFWRIRPGGFQDSGDDLLNDFEEYLLGTSIATNDTDGDTLSDADEFIQHLDPTLRDTEGDGLGDDWELLHGFDPVSATGTNGALGDADSDGYSNLEEQLLGNDPLISDSGGSTGTVATIRYYYDQDDRLSDFFCGTEVAQKTILTVSHNISEEILAK